MPNRLTRTARWTATLLVLLAGGCSQPWQFSKPEYLRPSATSRATTPAGAASPYGPPSVPAVPQVAARQPLSNADSTGIVSTTPVGAVTSVRQPPAAGLPSGNPAGIVARPAVAGPPVGAVAAGGVAVTAIPWPADNPAPAQTVAAPAAQLTGDCDDASDLLGPLPPPYWPPGADALAQASVYTPLPEPLPQATYPESSPWPGPTIAAGFQAGEATEPAVVPVPVMPPDGVPAAVIDATVAVPQPTAPQVAATRPRLLYLWDETKRDIIGDYRGYYSWHTLIDLTLAVGVAAPLANTSLDGDFQRWYQRDVRTRGTDDLASFWKPLGEGKYVIPAWAGLAIIGKLPSDVPILNGIGELGYRTTRGYLVGAPPLLAMQYLLGASRPGEASWGSRWQPFHDTNGVSGHAFMGAMPFLTAAEMVKNPWARGTLYVLSTFTAWSRVNDNQHYLSQICLGWYMAYLSARVVNATELDQQRWSVTPIVSPQLNGVAMMYKW